MSFPNGLPAREMGKFRENKNNNPAVAVINDETPPTDSSKNNPSYALSYTSDELTQIDITISGTTYRRTLTWTDNNLTAMSDWSEV